jgi:hypothetical protein
MYIMKHIGIYWSIFMGGFHMRKLFEGFMGVLVKLRLVEIVYLEDVDGSVN